MDNIKEVNSVCWEHVVAVPHCIISNYMKLAPHSALMVILYLLANRKSTSQDIASDLGLTVDNVEEAYIYWKNMGVIASTESIMQPAIQTVTVTVTDSVPTPEPPKISPVIIELHKNKSMTPKEIAERVTEVPEISFMFQMAESVFGRLLNNTEQRALIWMHDYLSLRPDVILMLLEYCKSRGKMSMRYMEQLAVSWQEKQIDTVEAADREIERLKFYHSMKGKVMSGFGIQNRKLTSSEETFIKSWTEKHIDIELITYAYDKSVDLINKVSFPYINKMLCDWREKGLTTKEEVEKNETEGARNIKKKKKFSKNTSKERDTDAGEYRHSYDLDAIEKWAKDNVPKAMGKEEMDELRKRNI